MDYLYIIRVLSQKESLVSDAITVFINRAYVLKGVDD
jgi:hypothetical protein